MQRAVERAATTLFEQQHTPAPSLYSLGHYVGKIEAILQQDDGNATFADVTVIWAKSTHDGEVKGFGLSAKIACTLHHEWGREQTLIDGARRHPYAIAATHHTKSHRSPCPRRSSSLLWCWTSSGSKAPR